MHEALRKGGIDPVVSFFEQLYFAPNVDIAAKQFGVFPWAKAFILPLGSWNTCRRPYDARLEKKQH